MRSAPKRSAMRPAGTRSAPRPAARPTRTRPTQRRVEPERMREIERPDHQRRHQHRRNERAHRARLALSTGSRNIANRIRGDAALASRARRGLLRSLQPAVEPGSADRTGRAPSSWRAHRPRASAPAAACPMMSKEVRSVFGTAFSLIFGLWRSTGSGDTREETSGCPAAR